jgi:anaerobic ribonucleoside-triphosphate reductase
MDPALMRLNDWIAEEKEVTRHATQVVVTTLVLAELEKEGGPDLEKLKAGLQEMLERSKAWLDEYHKLMEKQIDGTV